ncbi:ABC transporter ATP-binding protein [Patescibacteria group bacterium]|nr:ABC transporter ATP-binding protein [Patescibacteria group bacterium]
MLAKGWKILFRHLFERKREVILLSILGVLSGLANGSVPYIIGQFFDALISPDFIIVWGTLEISVYLLLAIWVIVQIISNTVDWIIDIKRRRMGTYLRAGHIARSTSAILELPVSLFKNEKIGEIIDRIQRSSNALAVIVEQVVIDLTPQFLSVIIGVSIVFIINPVLALILVTGVSLYIVTLIKIVPPLITMQKEGQKVRREAWGVMGDAISNFQTVKQSTAEEYERDRLWNKFIHGFAFTWNKIERIWTGISFYQRVIVVLTQLTVFIVSISFITNGSLTIGELIAVNSYGLLIFGPFATMGRNWQVIQNGLIAIEQTDEMINLPKEAYESKVDVGKEGLKGNVEFKNVVFKYDAESENVLRGISLNAYQGEIVALVGESGVGKSTTIELLSGYYFPTEGEVLIDGHSIQDIGLKYLRENIAVVPQEPVLFNDTIEVNIHYGKINATLGEVKEAARKAHADEFIEKFPNKYEQIVGERGIKLSVGQKQRIAIARAILRNPKILILDEPTSALDAKTERFITGSLEELMAGRTTFIIAHRLSTVRKADKIFVLIRGKLLKRAHTMISLK